MGTMETMDLNVEVVDKETQFFAEQPGYPAYQMDLLEAANLYRDKNRDYGGGDPFGNFKSVEKFGMEPWLGVIVRLSDKVNRVAVLAASGKPGYVKDESIEDTLLDLGVYSLICLAIMTPNLNKAAPGSLFNNWPGHYLFYEALLTLSGRHVHQVLSLDSPNSIYAAHERWFYGVAIIDSRWHSLVKSVSDIINEDITNVQDVYDILMPKLVILAEAAFLCRLYRYWWACLTNGDRSGAEGGI